MFNVFNALLLRPLPFHDPERLVWATGTSDNLSAQTAQVMNAAALREDRKNLSQNRRSWCFLAETRE